MLDGFFMAKAERDIAYLVCPVCDGCTFKQRYDQKCSCSVCGLVLDVVLLEREGSVCIFLLLVSGTMDFSQWLRFLETHEIALPAVACPICKKQIGSQIDSLGTRCWGCCDVLWYPVISDRKLVFDLKLAASEHEFGDVPLSWTTLTNYWEQLAHYAAKYVVSADKSQDTPRASVVGSGVLVRPRSRVAAPLVAKPGVVENAVRRVSDVSDFLGTFVGISPQGFVARQTLYDKYVSVCDVPVPPQKLYQELRDSYPMVSEAKRRRDGKSVRGFVGIKLR